ncbi:MAG: protein phosphatase [Cyanobium sp.]
MADSTPEASRLQATLVDFALGELVRQHRASFQPLWTADSWAKLLIWLALNCGCSGEEAALQRFAEALGPVLGARLRRLFFQRELEDLQLQLLADPAEPQVLALPLEASEAGLSPERIAQALERVGLAPRLVLEPARWGRLERAVVIPWLPHP